MRNALGRLITILNMSEEINLYVNGYIENFQKTKGEQMLKKSRIEYPRTVG